MSRPRIIRASIDAPSPASVSFIDPSVARECRQIERTLSAEEIVMMLALDPAWKLSANAPHAHARMVEARSLLMQHVRESLPGCGEPSPAPVAIQPTKGAA